MNENMQRKDDDERSYDVTVIGAALIDCVVKNFNPQPITKTGFHADSLTLAPGGEAFNQGVSEARLGLKVQVLAGLAKDSAGDLITQKLMEAGADVSGIVCRDAPQTPVTVMFVGEDGNRKSVTGDAHAYNFHPECFFSEMSGHTKAVSIASLFRAPFNDVNVIADILTRAKERRLTVYADTKLPNSTRLTLDDIAEVLPFIDYITPNEDEAFYYTGESDPVMAADVFLKYGIKNVIIKLGAKGCFFKNASEELRLPAMKIQAVDATGAGDNFAAGFIAARTEGKSHREALEFATACAALCTMSIGATGAVRSRVQVLDFLKKSNLQGQYPVG